MGTDRRTIHLMSVSFQMNLEPVVSRFVVAKNAAVGGQIQIAVIVKIGPCIHVGFAQTTESFRASHVAEIPRSVVAVQNAVISRIHRCQEKIEITVVVIIRQAGRRVRFLITKPSATTLILKIETSGRSQVF